MYRYLEFNLVNRLVSVSSLANYTKELYLLNDENSSDMIVNGFSRYLVKEIKSNLHYNKSYLEILDKDIKFLEWKKSLGISKIPSIDIFKEVINNIGYQDKYNNRVLIGINEKAKFLNTKYSVYYIAKCLEFGTMNLVPRLKYRPIANKVVNNIYGLFNKYRENNIFMFMFYNKYYLVKNKIMDLKDKFR